MYLSIGLNTHSHTYSFTYLSTQVETPDKQGGVALVDDLSEYRCCRHTLLEYIYAIFKQSMIEE